MARHSDPADGRVTLVTLTAEGLRYLRSLGRTGADALAQLIDKLPPGEAGALAAAIPALGHLQELGYEQCDPGSRRPASSKVPAKTSWCLPRVARPVGLPA